MSDLKTAWNELQIETSNLTQISEQEVKQSITVKSKGTMETLRKRVLYKFLFCLFFTICIAAIIPFAGPMPAKVLLTILLAAYIFGGVLIFQESQELGKGIDHSESLASIMTTFRDRIKKVLKYEELIGLTLYPVSLAAGFIFGMSEGGSGAYMDKTSDWVFLAVALIIGVPLSHWAAKKMNRVAFGEYLERLELNIAELKEESE